MRWCWFHFVVKVAEWACAGLTSGEKQLIHQRLISWHGIKTTEGKSLLNKLTTSPFSLPTFLGIGGIKTNLKYSVFGMKYIFNPILFFWIMLRYWARLLYPFILLFRLPIWTASSRSCLIWAKIKTSFWSSLRNDKWGSLIVRVVELSTGLTS